MASVVDVLRDGLTRYYQGSKRRPVNIVSKILLVLAVLLILGLNASDAANSRKTVKLVSLTNKYLTVASKQIKGDDKDTSGAELELHSYGMHGEVTLKAIESDLYIAVNSSGKIHLQKTQTNGAVFIYADIPDSKGFRSFQSKTYANKYLAITSKGVVTTIMPTKKLSTIQEIHFAVIWPDN